ncbi:MAG TPA: magnesium/cobalt transporter CorA [Spirochaetota bacterium]|nr:magnesium/cobalt transporter CorA [Spirochaetota bacterium]HPS86783.1 magnesium/cobalt transporter CorA [Spirochaetota bacterium]
MKIHVSRRSKKSGAPPGTLIHIGRDATSDVIITRCCYDETDYVEERNVTLDKLFAAQNDLAVEWVNFDGIHDVKMIEQIGTHYGIDFLILEDIVNSNQRAKIEDYGDYIYIVLKMLTISSKTGEIETEQISIVFNSRIVFSFQEKKGDDFEPLRDRIRKKGKIRKMGTDYLTYSIIDYVTDNYFIVLEKIGDRIEKIEDEVLSSPDDHTLRKIHELKRDTLMIKKTVWPLRDVLGLMIRPENDFIQDSIVFNLRDAYDHTIEVIDTVEAYRDFMSGLLDIYLSGISNRMNEVMKVLTLISTIFIPLTFIAGVYGMNFKRIPETEWYNGYYYILGFMVFVVLIMFIFFKKKKWL